MIGCLLVSLSTNPQSYISTYILYILYIYIHIIYIYMHVFLCPTTSTLIQPAMPFPHVCTRRSRSALAGQEAMPRRWDLYASCNHSFCVLPKTGVNPSCLPKFICAPSCFLKCEAPKQVKFSTICGVFAITHRAEVGF